MIGHNHREEDELIASVRGLVIGWMSSRKNVEEMKEDLQELCANLVPNVRSVPPSPTSQFAVIANSTLKPTV